MGGPLDPGPAGVSRAQPSGGAGAPHRDDAHRRGRSSQGNSSRSWPSWSAASASTGSTSHGSTATSSRACWPTSRPRPGRRHGRPDPGADRREPVLRRTGRRRVARDRRRSRAGAPPRRRARPGLGRLGRGPGAPARRVGCRCTDRRRAARVGLRPAGADRACRPARGRRSPDPRACRWRRTTRTWRSNTPCSVRSSTVSCSRPSGRRCTRATRRRSKRAPRRSAGGRQGARPAPTAADLAYHWDAAGDDARALPAMVEAARVAESGYAYLDAHRRYLRSIELCDRLAASGAALPVDPIEVLVRAAETAVLIGEYDSAVELGRRAIAGVDARVDPGTSGRPARAAALVFLGGGRPCGGGRGAGRGKPARPARATVGRAGADPRPHGRRPDVDRPLRRLAPDRGGGPRCRPDGRVARGRGTGARHHRHRSRAARTGRRWHRAIPGGPRDRRGPRRRRGDRARDREPRDLARQGRTDRRGPRCRDRRLGARAGHRRRTDIWRAVARRRGEGRDRARAVGRGGWTPRPRAGARPGGDAGIRLRIQRGRLDTMRGDLSQAAAVLDAADAADEAAGRTGGDRAAILAARADLAAVLRRASDVRAAVAEGLRMAVERSTRSRPCPTRRGRASGRSRRRRSRTRRT